MYEVFVPINDRILVRPIAPPTRSESPLDLGQQQDGEITMRGTVVAYSRKVAELENFPSATVAFGSYAGKDIEVDGERLKLLYLEEVHGFYLFSHDSQTTGE